MRRATCALGNNEKNQLSAKFAQFPLPLHHSRLRQDHYDQVFVLTPALPARRILPYGAMFMLRREKV